MGDGVQKKKHIQFPFLFFGLALVFYEWYQKISLRSVITFI